MYKDTGCRLQAHRGVSTDAPNNTMPAFELAVEQGYDIIELDPKFTKDNVCVLIHNRTINATATKDGKAPEVDMFVKDMTLEELYGYDFGESFAPEFKGTKIPTMEEVLEFCERTGMPIKIDNVIETFPEEQQNMLFELIRGHKKAPVGVTGAHIDFLERVARAIPGVTIHYDGPVDEESLVALDALVDSKEKLYIWQRLDTPRTAWCKVPPVDPALSERIKAHGYLGVWILGTGEEMEKALAVGADIVETNGEIKPDGRIITPINKK